MFQHFIISIESKVRLSNLHQLLLESYLRSQYEVQISSALPNSTRQGQKKRVLSQEIWCENSSQNKLCCKMIKFDILKFKCSMLMFGIHSSTLPFNNLKCSQAKSLIVIAQFCTNWEVVQNKNVFVKRILYMLS